MAWLTGWDYRKEITVTNASASYQTKILVGESSGASGEEVDCGGNVAADFDDLRFTGSDGTTLLDYWIESITGSTPNCLATVWVENNATPDTTLYMYYGGTESAVSNGANTFIQFEDFEWGSDGDDLDTDGGSVDWTISASGGTSVADIDDGQDIGDETGFTGTRSGLFYRDGTNLITANIPQTAGSGYAIRFRHRKENAAGMRPIHGNGTYRILILFADDEDIIYRDDAAWQDTGTNIAVDTWELIEINNIDFASTQTYDIYLNGSRIKEGASMQTDNGQQDIFEISNASGTSSGWIDDLIIRKWAATEPSFAFGSEEISYTPRHGFVNFQDPAIV